MKISEARLTLYAFISAIETDLKNLIITQIIPLHNSTYFIPDSGLRDTSIKRFTKDHPGLDPESNLNDIVHYVDFQDTYKILLQNSQLKPDCVDKVKPLVEKLDHIVPIRNRVMHNRPLLHGDLGFVYGFLQDVSVEDVFSTSRLTLQQIETDPNYILSIDLPRFTAEDEIVYHNLPVPDFDETGFIGRKKDALEITKLLLGSTRVVSVIGEGGMGKSALMLKVAYDIADMGERCPFDMILWTTAKTTMLTPAGIVEIKDAIDNFPGLVRNLAGHIEDTNKSLTENIDLVLEVFKTFKTLLIIDNLETIINEDIKAFIREAQLHSKIAITSRVGLGELEYPRHLDGLSEAESVTLIREAAKMRNEEMLVRLNNSRLSEIAKHLHYNPLALKWFVNSVVAGKNPDEVVMNKDSLLEFCLSNVYDKMSNSAKLILNTILAARTPLTEAELAFYTEKSAVELKKAIISLIATSFVKRTVTKNSAGDELSYSITDFAREYLLKHNKLGKVFIAAITDKKNKLIGSSEQRKIAKKHSEFSVIAIEARTSTEIIASRYLQQALQLSRQQEYEPALDKVGEAKNLAPNYFEVYRVSGFIKSLSDDLLGAEEDFQIALEIQPDNARLNFYYSGFLLKSLGDSAKAFEYISKAYRDRPDANEVVIEYARNLVYQGTYDDGISALEKLIRSNPDLSVKTSQIVGTLLINAYRRYAEKEYVIKKDTGEAFKKLLKANDVFTLCTDMRVVDERMIDEFGNALFYMLTIIDEQGLSHLLTYAQQIYDKCKVLITKSSYHKAIAKALESL
ncbi:NB-ARC domain-containing protein [Geomonas sp. RF6]|uniref:tetratricopeptide repeat protein n=1 Tax=Geomonas sp. RF6 TaxID=2897342 RepID=UPI001E55C7A0|nr:NB-ARC domain-containing protein [Geomonas sp. RF6]UFS72060.1 NB-ARC domain-containing protein [Geomonas sp. RF6]